MEAEIILHNYITSDIMKMTGNDINDSNNTSNQLFRLCQFYVTEWENYFIEKEDPIAANNSKYIAKLIFESREFRKAVVSLFGVPKDTEIQCVVPDPECDYVYVLNDPNRHIY